MTTCGLCWDSPGCLLVLFGVNYFTRTGAIARATTKEAIRQPVYLMLLVVGSVIMWAKLLDPFFSLGDDTKMFIDCGLATILICSLLVAIWTASLSVAEEIEGKTAMTLLSKPIPAASLSSESTSESPNRPCGWCCSWGLSWSA